MFEKFKNKANEVLNYSTKIASQATDIAKIKANQAINKYQEYQERERDTISQYLISKINEYIKEKYKKQYLKGEVMPGKCLLFETKIGGFPYLPHNVQIPKDLQGNDMRLLVQINCEDLKTINKFPSKGLIQIFLKRDKEYGLNDFKILYHEVIDPSVRIEELYDKTLIDELEFFPIRKECNLYFSKDIDSISIKDIKYYNEFMNLLQKENNYRNFTHKEIMLMINNDIEKISIKVDGNPNFVSLNNSYVDEILLFQLVPDGKYIQTENDSILSFYIKKEDLENLDFSNVKYIISK